MDWNTFLNFLVKLSREGLRWYQVVNNGGEVAALTYEGQRKLSRVLDPETDEQLAEDVKE